MFLLDFFIKFIGIVLEYNLDISVIGQGNYVVCISLRCYEEEPDSWAGKRGPALTWYEFFSFAQ